jgi:hypothetical protein
LATDAEAVGALPVFLVFGAIGAFFSATAGAIEAFATVGFLVADLAGSVGASSAAFLVAVDRLTFFGVWGVVFGDGLSGLFSGPAF